MMVFVGIWQNAKKVLGHTPGPLTVGALGRIVFSEEPLSGLSWVDAADRALQANANFKAILTEARELYFLVAPLDPESYGRRVITYSYEEQPGVDQLRPRSFSRLFRPQPFVSAEFEVPAAADCHSFHFELTCPPEVKIPSRCSRLFVRESEGGDSKEVASDDGSDHRAHVFYSGAGPIDKAVFKSRLILLPTGLVLAMRLLVFATFLLTTVGACAVWLYSQQTLDSIDRASLTTTVLVVPTVITAILAIRSGHGMTSRMALGLRVTLLASATSLYLAALFSLSLHPWCLRIGWTSAASIAMLCAIRVVLEMCAIHGLKSNPEVS